MGLRRRGRQEGASGAAPIRPRADDADFDQLFLSNFVRVRAIAERIVGRRAVAEEVAAEAFARAFARWGHVRTLDSPIAWVVRTATNAAIDILRHDRTTLPEPPSDTEAAFESARLRHELLPALRSLSSRQRQVVVLRYVVDMSDDEVATALGVSSGTVKTHLHRALPALRARLEDAG